ncbi:MAG: lactate racemase domain-containing protein [Brevefilum sp.]
MTFQQLMMLDGFLDQDAVQSFITEGLNTLNVDRKRVVVLVPDQTRTMPLPMVFNVLTDALDGRVEALDFIVALGTHPPLDETKLSQLFGRPVKDGMIGKHHIYNHTWGQPETLREIGVISGREMEKLTEGHFKVPLSVQINQRIFEYDHVLICGPVSPNVSIGYSGGNKYFFPGISGPGIINFTHWLAALLTNVAVNGSGYTPVRAVVDRAAQFINLHKSCLAFVLNAQGIYGAFFGTPEEAWEGASALSARKHIVYTGRTFDRGLAVMPEMFDELWVGGKGMYKLEPVIADGGEVIIYAPHIDRISLHHGALIRQIGYHVRDYFLKQWEKFKHIPLGVLAHSTHLKGLGTYDAETGEEHPRIQVTLATGISEETCKEINLGYMDPDSINIAEWEGREDEGLLLVKEAGEHLYRVKS